MPSNAPILSIIACFPLPYGSAPAGTQLSERLAFKRQFARSPKALDLEHADVASLILHE
jgi:hypothetical protein